MAAPAAAGSDRRRDAPLAFPQGIAGQATSLEGGMGVSDAELPDGTPGIEIGGSLRSQPHPPAGHERGGSHSANYKAANDICNLRGVRLKDVFVSGHPRCRADTLPAAPATPVPGSKTRYGSGCPEVAVGRDYLPELPDHAACGGSSNSERCDERTQQDAERYGVPPPGRLMVAKVLGLGRSFTRLAAYRLEKDERVDWADTRNLPTLDPGRAPRLMAATAKAAPDLKRLAGGSMGRRKLEKPVLHYTLYWPHDQRPARAEMEQAAAESLTALGLERHEALIVAYPAHLHVIANRVHPETGRAANLGLSWIRLSEWAERWERDPSGGPRTPSTYLRAASPPSSTSTTNSPRQAGMTPYSPPPSTCSTTSAGALGFFCPRLPDWR